VATSSQGRGKIPGDSRRDKSRSRQTKSARRTIYRFGLPALDDLRPPYPALEKPVDARQLAARDDTDWRDDERSIAALARSFKVSVRQLRGSTAERLELERLWKLRDYTPETQRWRRRAWYYRKVLIRLGKLRVTGFNRGATPGETKRSRWTPEHLHLLIERFNAVQRREGCTDAATLQLLLDDGYFRDGKMTMANAKKLLGAARRVEQKLKAQVGVWMTPKKK
jgi:hypothetical protein